MVNMTNETKLLSIEGASAWASEYLGCKVTSSNIAYLIQYGRVNKHVTNGKVFVDITDLQDYYNANNRTKELEWKKRLGEDLIWELSFDDLKESERTKHVHRLHPYKGKFIPQLVEYFIDEHTDEHKREVYFNKGGILLDPFCGSGTTLVQANELGINAIGIDVSDFNTLISNVKVSKYILVDLYNEARKINQLLKQHAYDNGIVSFENELGEELSKYNDNYFPAPEYRYKVRRGEINEVEYGAEKEAQFNSVFTSLIEKHGIKIGQTKPSAFIDKWYVENIRQEIEIAYAHICSIDDENISNALKVILSRTIRSCRATTHFDLATLKEPVFYTYYCHKHGKICKPLFSITNWWPRYFRDTIGRLAQYDKLRTDTYQLCLTGDARTINILEKLAKTNPTLASLVANKKIDGIFSSPPYVGLIDYHEQHAYAYELFNMARNDEYEIGPLSNGQGARARAEYVKSISEVLKNCRKYLKPDFNVFLVANDKYDLYPEISKKSGMKIVNRYKRPVLNRTERDKGAYSETIFHLKDED